MSREPYERLAPTNHDPVSKPALQDRPATEPRVPAPGTDDIRPGPGQDRGTQNVQVAQVNPAHRGPQ
jgi:hypothetical protein